MSPTKKALNHLLIREVALRYVQLLKNCSTGALLSRCTVTCYSVHVVGVFGKSLHRNHTLTVILSQTIMSRLSRFRVLSGKTFAETSNELSAKPSWSIENKESFSSSEKLEQFKVKKENLKHLFL
jgi:hypothetical protein